MPPKFRRAAFTWNNYTDANVEYLEHAGPEVFDYLIAGFEKCPTTGTPHLQGYVEFKSPLDLGTIKHRLDPKNGSKSALHIEKALKNRAANISYCKKLDTKDIRTKWKRLMSEEEEKKIIEQGGKPAYEIIHLPLFIEIIHKQRQQGKKQQIAEVVYAAINGEQTLAELASEYPEEVLKHANNLKTIMNCSEADKMRDTLLKSYENVELRPWQKEFIGTVIDYPPDNRTVYWIWDKIGNKGKTWLCKYLCAKHDAAYFTNGKTSDIACAYKGEKIALFDFTRSVEGYLNYSIIETIKNGILFNSKYQSGSKYFPVPHVICFANWEPDRSMLSNDRWAVIELTADD